MQPVKNPLAKAQLKKLLSYVTFWFHNIESKVLKRVPSFKIHLWFIPRKISC